MNQPLNFYPLILSTLALMFVSTADAQEARQLILNGQVQCDLQGEVRINSDGNVAVEVLDLAACIGEEKAPVAPQLTRTVTEPVAPGEIVLDWSSSSTATDCEASSSPILSGWSGSVGTGQNQVTTLSGLAASSYNLALRCSNGAGTSPWTTVTATVSSSTECADRQPPSGWARLGEAGTQACYYEAGVGWTGKDCTLWQGGISDIAFHKETGLTHRMAVGGRPDAKQYLAIEFNTTGMSTTETGRLAQVTDGFADYADMIVTISSCPGDFHQAVKQETGCYLKTNVLNGTVIAWGGTSSGRTCQLESGQRYYLNMAPTTSSLGTDPDLFQTHHNCEPTLTGKANACGAAFQMQ